MSYFYHRSRFVKLGFLFLAAAIMFFCVASIATMNHEGGGMAGGPMLMAVASGDCNGAQNTAGSCIDFHFGVMTNMSQVAHQGFNVLALLFLIGVLFFLVAFGFRQIIEQKVAGVKYGLRQLYEKTVAVFALQLGFWLTLFEKRDPAGALA